MIFPDRGKNNGICAFYKDGGVLGKIRLPKTTTEIGSEAFSWETTDGPENICNNQSLKDKINAEALKRNVRLSCVHIFIK